MPNQKRRLKFLWAFIALLVAAETSFAHDFWIEPDRFQVEPGQQVALTLRQGVGLKGDSLPYITQLFLDFSIIDANGRRDIRSEIGSDPAAVVSLAPGPSLVGYLSNRDVAELNPEKFAAYLAEEGMEYILDQRKARGEADKPARENFIRCAKTLLRAGAATNNSTYRTRLDYTLELVPGKDPYTMRPGGSLPLQLFYLGQPIQGIRVKAFTRDRPDNPIYARTDSEGQVKLKLPYPGVWLINAVHMIPLEADTRARWESYWASFLFELL